MQSKNRYAGITAPTFYHRKQQRRSTKANIIQGESPLLQRQMGSEEEGAPLETH